MRRKCIPRTPLLRSADCAVCKKNYAEGVSYSCTKCSSANDRSAVGLAVFIAVAALMATTVLLSYLGRGTDEWAEERSSGRGCWQRFTLNSHDFLLKVFPLTAIKIVVVVWQIVFQVRIWSSKLDEHSVGVRVTFPRRLFCRC